MKYPFLALLANAPRHGYELGQALELLFGDALPPLNVGQIYTTLQRLERDGLVEGVHVTQAHRPDKKVYELTPAGRAALAEWLAAPVPPPQLRDEFFMKLVLSHLPGVAGGASAVELIARQRQRYMQALRDLNARAGQAAAGSNPTAALMLEGAILHLQADLKWLELCEEHLTR
jgi:DNA-binding PadR family transcriptional regulator